MDAAHELDLHAAFAALRANLRPITERIVVSTRAAGGRILAADLICQADLPAFDQAAMDGYAVRSADCAPPARLRVIGQALAGHPAAVRVEAGTAVRIMTGAPLPAGADAVVMLEDTLADGDSVLVRTAVASGMNIRRRGEQCRAGDVAIVAGTTLAAAHLGLATALGASSLAVLRPLRVGIASTGDELCDPPAALSEGASFDANRPWLARACEAAGFAVTDLGICRDDEVAFARLLHRVRQEGLNALVVSGGSALGDADVVRQAQSVRFFPLNIRPGRGILFGDFGPFVLLGLPGNAVAAFVMFHLLVLPALRVLAGASDAAPPPHLPLPLAVDVQGKPGRIDYRRARYVLTDAGAVAVAPLAQQGAAMLSTVTAADALIAVGPRAHYRAGETIPAVPLAGLPG
ncbi:MAG: molybdopterin molybdotransferase MoeA [Sutterellaceae bacterium]|nr:molybdopterin molybdotransferase MoeA [Burkholderiaceae bacterium]MCX7901690.1 molybdopterin molybdotransferase MoeA [Burkholderiaceae bacterium]MDW8429835.1 molybdopterin molybdotransferase MoeA [Sutterellaceae bacterium]